MRPRSITPVQMTQLAKPKRLVIIGLGGIGSLLTSFLAKEVAFSATLKDIEIVFIDGDNYEAKNAVRQHVGGLRNKAEQTQANYEETYPFVTFKAVKAYIGEESKFDQGKFVLPAATLIQENDWVFGCVDNNRTRLIVSKRMQELQNAVLIDGGNELTDGSVQIFIRHEGKNLTPPIEKYQPSIKEPTDKAPYQLSCEALAATGSTQILAANATASLVMFLSMRRLLEPVNTTGIASVAYFDISKALSEGPTIVFQRYPEEK